MTVMSPLPFLEKISNITLIKLRHKVIQAEGSDSIIGCNVIPPLQHSLYDFLTQFYKVLLQIFPETAKDSLPSLKSWDELHYHRHRFWIEDALQQK